MLSFRQTTFVWRICSKIYYYFRQDIYKISYVCSHTHTCRHEIKSDSGPYKTWRFNNNNKKTFFFDNHNNFSFPVNEKVETIKLMWHKNKKLNMRIFLLTLLTAFTVGLCEFIVEKLLKTILFFGTPVRYIF